MLKPLRLVSLPQGGYGAGRLGNIGRPKSQKAAGSKIADPHSLGCMTGWWAGAGKCAWRRRGGPRLHAQGSADLHLTAPDLHSMYCGMVQSKTYFSKGKMHEEASALNCKVLLLPPARSTAPICVDRAMLDSTSQGEGYWVTTIVLRSLGQFIRWFTRWFASRDGPDATLDPTVIPCDLFLLLSLP